MEVGASWRIQLWILERLARVAVQLCLGIFDGPIRQNEFQDFHEFVDILNRRSDDNIKSERPQGRFHLNLNSSCKGGVEFLICRRKQDCYGQRWDQRKCSCCKTTADN